MILIFGRNGYMGSAISKECERRGLSYCNGIRVGMGHVTDQIDRIEATLCINAAAFIPNPSVDACKDHKDKTICGNLIWPHILAEACYLRDIPIMHLSTGCLFDEQREYTEYEPTTRGWDGYCGFYVGTKKLAEGTVSCYWRHYILRLRLPFDEVDHPRNYLTKLTKFDKVFEHVNSLTHRGDFAKWALDLWEKKAPFGTYHCVNSGQISAKALTMNLAMNGLIPSMPQFAVSPDTTGAWLSNAKLAAAIGPVRSVHEAVAESISNWRKE